MIAFDSSQASLTIRAASTRMRAARKTIAGSGHVVIRPTGDRNVKVMASMAAKGKQFLRITIRERKDITEFTRRDISRAITAAMKSGTSRQSAKRIAMLTGGRHAIEIIRRAIIKGRVGRNDPRYRAAKGRWQLAHGVTRFGIPSAYGIRTGRLIMSLRAIWRSGGGT